MADQRLTPAAAGGADLADGVERQSRLIRPDDIEDR
jgi:hypothetical protein